MIVKTCICGWNDIHTILTHNLGIEILFDGYLVNVEYLFLFVPIQNAKDVEIKKIGCNKPRIQVSIILRLVFACHLILLRRKN